MNPECPPLAKHLSPGEQRTLIVCGLIVAYGGLFGFAMSDNRFGHFVSAAMVLNGLLLALPQLVARAIAQSSSR